LCIAVFCSYRIIATGYAQEKAGVVLHLCPDSGVYLAKLVHVDKYIKAKLWF
jgi:hypothetical protein